ncbi:MAG TPA: hypothetical protein VFS16_11555, partial [Acidimicrobiia bacterium]|nr:hypothetical protein [Acidimicrobiia bacterium]
GAVAPSDAVQARGALAAMAFGLVMLGRDTTVQAHALVTQGCIRALTGTLLRSSSTADLR